ncbi:MAG: TSUP family transporter [Gemmataceae bacterium]
MKAGLFVLLAVLTTWFLAVWIACARRTGETAPPSNHTLYHTIVGFVFGFLDTLGLGNFAPTTAAFKLRGTVPDEHIPGTLNVGYALPTIFQAFIYISIVEVDEWTLVLMIAAAVLGAWLGAGVVARWPRRNIQIGMGTALLLAAVIMTVRQAEVGPSGGDSLALAGPLLALALAGNFVLGALMTLGIGLYAPCLLLVSLLGMNPRAAFPIMMGSCAALMPVGSVRFLRAGSYQKSAALALTLAAIPALLIAAYLVREMSLTALHWLVVAVVLYTSVLMLRSAFR